MPLSINVGLSRKASKDYQSTGTSINIVAELDATLLGKPDELQKQIDGLYQQAQDAIDRNGGVPEATPRDTGRDQRQTQNGDRSGDRTNRRNGRNGNNSGNGAGQHRNGTSNGNNGSRMTDSQARAIDAIAARLGIDPRAEAREIVGELDELTIRQASELIDHLKSIEPVRGSRNGRVN